MSKHEWRKKEKDTYLPKSKPAFIEVPTFQFATIRGEGNPNSSEFKEYVGALYSLSYTLKMTLKKRDVQPMGYSDYTVYPLEGVWDLQEAAREHYDGTLNKDDLAYHLMIRQPDFVTPDLFGDMLDLARKKKNPNPKLDQVLFETISEGPCVQMLHVGPFENEPESFRQMEAFAEAEGLTRLSKTHREIYLSDINKVPAEKWKTVLRFRVE